MEWLRRVLFIKGQDCSLLHCLLYVLFWYCCFVRYFYFPFLLFPPQNAMSYWFFVSSSNFVILLILHFVTLLDCIDFIFCNPFRDLVGMVGYKWSNYQGYYYTIPLPYKAFANSKFLSASIFPFPIFAHRQKFCGCSFPHNCNLWAEKTSEITFSAYHAVVKGIDSTRNHANEKPPKWKVCNSARRLSIGGFSLGRK